MPTFLVVDDHKLINDGMKLLIESRSGFNVVGQCFNGKEALEFVQIRSADFIVMDINMPLMDGIEATGLIKKLKPEIKIIALTMVGDFATVHKMIESGADGYILKNTDSRELFDAVELIDKGGTYINPEISQVLLKGMKEQKGRAHLTKREKEILHYVVQGLSTKQIADVMSLGEETIKSHRKNLMSKLNVNNVAALVKIALDQNLS